LRLVDGPTVGAGIDGIFIDDFYVPEQWSDNDPESPYYIYRDFVSSVIDNIEMKEIVGIEVMNNERYAGAYDYKYAHQKPTVTEGQHAYIEITSRSGHIFNAQSRRNITSYTPPPMSWPKEFYRPRYTPDNIKTSLPDARSTIHWQPHLLVSKTGTAFSSFYAADKPGTYTVIIQGTNFKGALGYQKAEIVIK
jgi:hypothetical protein